MSEYYAAGSTIGFFFETRDVDGEPVAPSSAFDSADIRIYKGTSAIQRSSASGITVTSPFDSLTGFHACSIDSSDNTDAGFYTEGSPYTVVLVTSKTVDGNSITNNVLKRFWLGPVPANVVEVSGDPTAANNMETAFDGGSYNVGGGGVVAASVTGAVGSVTGAVGSVTGNVGGNVTGSVGSVVGAVGSVTGAVGSVTGNVGGNVTGSVGSVLGEINATSGTIKTLDALDTAQDTQHSTTQSSLTTVLARLGAWTGTGVNTILGAFKALLNKAASNPSDIGGTFDPAADSTEAIRDRGDAAWITATSVTVSDKTGFKLASDGLDLVTSWTVGITGNITGNLSGSVGSVSGAVGSVTGNVGGNVTGSVGSVLGGIGTTGGTITTLDALDTAQDSQHSTTQSSLTTVLARLGSWTGTGVNTILGAFKALLSKTASTPSDIGGTFDAAADSTEAIRDRGDAAWGTATGFSTHSAADVWAAGTRTLTAFSFDVTLATSQPNYAPATATNVTDARDAILTQGNSAWATATGFAVPGDEMDLVDSPNATAVGVIQDGLSTHSAADAATAVWNAGTRTLSDKTGFALASNGVDLVIIEGSITAGAGLTNDTGTQLTSINLRQALALILAGDGGILAGSDTTTSLNNITIKQAGKPSGNTRIAATTDESGNRDTLTLKVPD